jgi:hypothetical protein
MNGSIGNRIDKKGKASMSCSKEKAAYHREWRQKNKEKTAAYRRKYRQKNQEKEAAYQREYYQKDVALILRQVSKSPE